jgi:hypothetical protein
MFGINCIECIQCIANVNSDMFLKQFLIQLSFLVTPMYFTRMKSIEELQNPIFYFIK